MDGTRSCPTVARQIDAGCPAKKVVKSASGACLASAQSLKFDRGPPERIYCDNGSEFASSQMDLWAYTNQVQIDFSRRGRPTDNAVIESFNGRFREECLNTHWFESLEDAQDKVDAWRWDYDEHRPHRSLMGLTPNEFAAKAKTGAAESLS